MTKEEFRQQMQILMFRQLAAKKDPEEMERIVTEKQNLRREYRKTLYAEMQKEENKGKSK